MKQEFTIVLSSNLDFEGMAVEIHFKNTPVARLNYDKGIDNMEIDLFLASARLEEIKFNLADFLEALDKAKKLALQCSQEDERRKQSGEWV